MKKIKQRAPTTFTTDSNGQRLAHIALAETGLRATLYAEDLARVLTAGWSPFWSYTRTGKPGSRRRYVLANVRNPKDGRRTLTVARLVAEAGRRQVVRYADGDTLNLRRENLLIQKGTAWMPVETLRPKKQDRREDTVTTAPHGEPRKAERFTANFREGICLLCDCPYPPHGPAAHTTAHSAPVPLKTQQSSRGHLAPHLEIKSTRTAAESLAALPCVKE